MSTPVFEWNDDDQVWECAIDSERMGVLDCRIYTDGFDDLPTEAQHKAAYDVCGLGPEFVAAMAQAIESQLLAATEEGADLDDVTEVEFEAAVIPPIRDISQRFAFLLFDSDIPCDIELVVLVRNATDFCVCDADSTYLAFDWDDPRLEQLFSDDDAG